MPAGVPPANCEPKRTACRRLRGGEDKGVKAMLDVVMLVIGIGFFALAVGYASACDRL
jgi:hypothetical protein